jgi:ribonuclease J
MVNSSEIAEDLGYIQIPEGLLIQPGEMKNYAPEKVCVLISGTQGEPMSALSRAAVDNHKHAKIEKGDTVVLSSRIIPGNEKAIYRMVDHPFPARRTSLRRWFISPVRQRTRQPEELKLIINLVRPVFRPGSWRVSSTQAACELAHHARCVGNVMLIER